MTNVVFTNLSSDMAVSIPLENITGVQCGMDDETLIEVGSGMYDMVCESLIEAIRLCVRAADESASSQSGTTSATEH